MSIKSKVAVFCLSLSILLSASLPAFAIYDKQTAGDFIVSGSGEYIFDADQNQLEIKSGEFIISTAAQTDQSILIRGDSTITLDGVDIQTSTSSPIGIATGVDALIVLSPNSRNSLSAAGNIFAGINLPSGASLTISCQEASPDHICTDSCGSLDISSVNGAGVGGKGANGPKEGEACGVLDISGGNIIISSRRLAIGGGHNQMRGTADGGSITISGGSVTVEGEGGIGSTDIDITGGRVSASGRTLPAIGSPLSSAEGSITISGGIVSASTSEAVPIGHASGSYKFSTEGADGPGNPVILVNRDVQFPESAQTSGVLFVGDNLDSIAFEFIDGEPVMSADSFISGDTSLTVHDGSDLKGNLTVPQDSVLSLDLRGKQTCSLTITNDGLIKNSGGDSISINGVSIPSGAAEISGVIVTSLDSSPLPRFGKEGSIVISGGSYIHNSDATIPSEITSVTVFPEYVYQFTSDESSCTLPSASSLEMPDGSIVFLPSGGKFISSGGMDITGTDGVMLTLDAYKSYIYCQDSSGAVQLSITPPDSLSFDAVHMTPAALLTGLPAETSIVYSDGASQTLLSSGSVTVEEGVPKILGDNIMYQADGSISILTSSEQVGSVKLNLIPPESGDPIISGEQFSIPSGGIIRATFEDGSPISISLSKDCTVSMPDMEYNGMISISSEDSELQIAGEESISIKRADKELTVTLPDGDQTIILGDSVTLPKDSAVIDSQGKIIQLPNGGSLDQVGNLVVDTPDTPTLPPVIPSEPVSPPSAPSLPVTEQPEPPSDAIDFEDVSKDSWYYDAVKYVVNSGLMSGTDDTLFSPGSPTSRGMLVTVLYRLEGSPAVSSDQPFSDVPSHWYYFDAIIWASSNGIIDGYGEGLFGPNDSITREQLAAIFYRYAKYKGIDISVSPAVSMFKDCDDIYSYALEPVNWAVQAGLLEGVENNLLLPKGTATRAQFATVLVRFCQLLSALEIA